MLRIGLNLPSPITADTFWIDWEKKYFLFSIYKKVALIRSTFYKELTEIPHTEIRINKTFCLQSCFETFFTPHIPWMDLMGAYFVWTEISSLHVVSSFYIAQDYLHCKHMLYET